MLAVLMPTQTVALHRRGGAGSRACSPVATPNSAPGSPGSIASAEGGYPFPPVHPAGSTDDRTKTTTSSSRATLARGGGAGSSSLSLSSGSGDGGGRYRRAGPASTSSSASSVRTLTRPRSPSASPSSSSTTTPMSHGLDRAAATSLDGSSSSSAAAAAGGGPSRLSNPMRTSTRPSNRRAISAGITTTLAHPAAATEAAVSVAPLPPSPSAAGLVTSSHASPSVISLPLDLPSLSSNGKQSLGHDIETALQQQRLIGSTSSFSSQQQQQQQQQQPSTSLPTTSTSPIARFSSGSSPYAPHAGYPHQPNRSSYLAHHPSHLRTEWSATRTNEADELVDSHDRLQTGPSSRHASDLLPSSGSSSPYQPHHAYFSGPSDQSSASTSNAPSQTSPAAIYSQLHRSSDSGAASAPIGLRRSSEDRAGRPLATDYAYSYTSHSPPTVALSGMHYAHPHFSYSRATPSSSGSSPPHPSSHLHSQDALERYANQHPSLDHPRLNDSTGSKGKGRSRNPSIDSSLFHQPLSTSPQHIQQPSVHSRLQHRQQSSHEDTLDASALALDEEDGSEVDASGPESSSAASHARRQPTQRRPSTASRAETASTAGGAAAGRAHGKQPQWDVVETDRLRSAKDALGRKMINQYARVAEIGKGVHGRVWLCEDTETNEFYAIKSVNRENRKQRSLRKSQAARLRNFHLDQDEHFSDDERDAEGRQRVGGSLSNYPYGRTDEEGEETAATTTTAPQSEDEGVSPPPDATAAGDPRDPNASFDERMQLNDPLPSPPPVNPDRALSRKGTHLKRPIVMDEKVRQEIAIMKRIHHPNVVQLREVIDDRRSKKIFMVLEYMPGGQVEWTKDNQPTMTVDESRSVFRDVVLGLEYLHYQGIIHRDIKPANLLWTQDRQTVKISDFGVSHVSEALARSSAQNPSQGRVGINDDRALRKTEGSPAFFAPELCAAVESTPVGTPVNELERVGSRPEYFRRNSGKNLVDNLRSKVTPLASAKSGSASFGIVPASASANMASRPRSNQRDSTASITTISPPLSEAAQQAHQVAQQQSDRSQSHTVRVQNRPLVGKGIDVWALGVTLYCLLFGYTPFHEATSEYELYNMIPKKEIAIPPFMGRDRLPTGSGVIPSYVETEDEFAEGKEVVHLLSRLLEKDPTKRIELHEVKKHPWVLRNLRDSQEWLAEHDLADTRVVHVTEEEVQHATAERTAPLAPQQGGLRASFKRFGEIFGFGQHNLLRRSVRRDRSKSVSSTSASVTTASAIDGRSEYSESRPTSRHPSIVKKKPSTYSSRSAAGGGGGADFSTEGTGSSSVNNSHTGSSGLPTAVEHQELDQTAFVASHASALKRKLVNAKAAREAHDAATLSASTGSSPPQNYSAALQPPAPPNLFRSLSGASAESRSPHSRRASISTHLQPPPRNHHRSVSSGASDAGSYASPAHADSPIRTQGSSQAHLDTGKESRPSLSSTASRPSFKGSSSGAGSDNESKLATGLRNVWNKLRSGSRTPAASPRGKTVALPREMTAVPLSSGQGQTRSLDPRAPNAANEGERARKDPPTLQSQRASRQSSYGADTEGEPTGKRPQPSGIVRASGLDGTTRLARQADSMETSKMEGEPRSDDNLITDSSDDLSDDFEEEDDYGEALSPMEGGMGSPAENTTQPSSLGTQQPLAWSDAEHGWLSSPALMSNMDPISALFPTQQQVQSSSASRGASRSRHQSQSGSGSSSPAHFSSSARGSDSHAELGNDATPRAPGKLSITSSIDQDAGRRSPYSNRPLADGEIPLVFKSDLERPLPPSRENSAYRDYANKVAPPSPGARFISGYFRTSSRGASAGATAPDAAAAESDDDNDEDDEEGQEVMIKPRARLRRDTNASNDRGVGKPVMP